MSAELRPGDPVQLAQPVTIRDRSGEMVLPAGKHGRVSRDHIEGGCWVLAVFRAAGRRLRVWLRPQDLGLEGGAA